MAGRRGALAVLALAVLIASTWTVLAGTPIESNSGAAPPAPRSAPPSVSNPPLASAVPSTPPHALAPAPPPHIAELRGDELSEAAEEEAPDVDAGAVVFDRVSQTLLVAHHLHEPFRADSLVKLLIAVEVLHEASRRGLTISENTAARMRTMPRDSNDAAASALWERQGGPAVIARTTELLGLTGTEPPDDPGRWGDTTTTAADVLRVYRYVFALPSRQRTLMFGSMAAAPEISASGFDQYFGIPDALEGDEWTIKQTWGRGFGSVETHTTGTVGTRRRYIEAVLTDYPDGTPWPVATDAGTETLAPVVG